MYILIYNEDGEEFIRTFNSKEKIKQALSEFVKEIGDRFEEPPRPIPLPNENDREYTLAELLGDYGFTVIKGEPKNIVITTEYDAKILGS